MKFGIVSDIHEDIVSLEKSLRICEEEKCDTIICLGDILGFEPLFYSVHMKRDASGCINLVKNNCKYIVVGNHDLFAIKKLPFYQDGFKYPENWYSLSLDERRSISQGKIWLYENEFLEYPLNASDIEFISNIDEFMIIESDVLNIHISHSIYPDLTGSSFFRLHNPWELKPHFARLDKLAIDLSFSGHMHSKYPLVAHPDSIKKIPYKESKLIFNKVQIIAPCLAKSKTKSGLIIADINNSVIKAIEINNFKFKHIFSLYAREK